MGRVQLLGRGVAALVAAAALSAESRTVEVGERWITEPIVLGPGDSGVRFAGKGGARGKISGGVRITGWTDRGGGVWGAKIPADPAGRLAYFEQLWVNGRRAQRARFPDTGFVHPAGFWMVSKKGQARRHFLSFGEEAAQVFDAAADENCAYAQLVVHVCWDFYRRPIDALHSTNRVIETHGNAPDSADVKKCWSTWGTNHLCYVENLRSAFDSPGEWFYDARAGEVLYRPPAGERIAEAVAPIDGLSSLVVLKGDVENGRFVENVTFENIDFEYTAPMERKGPAYIEAFQAAKYAGSVVLADGARNVVFKNCSFRHTGGNAVWFRRGCMSNEVVNCEMADLGAGGVRIGEFYSVPRKLFEEKGETNACVVVSSYKPESTAFTRVEDCLISSGGRYHPSGIGVLIGHASDNVVTHNDITDFFYSGVSVGWSWGYSGSVAQRNEISFNRIWKIGQGVLADMGGVYMLGTSFGTVVSNNVVHDVKTYSYGGWGLYMDEGSEGIVMENNLVYDTDDASFFQHYGRNNVYRNNIGVGGRRSAVGVAKQWRSNREHVQYTAERNILVWNGDSVPALEVVEDQPCEWRSNLWWCADGPVRFAKGRSHSEWAQKVHEIGGVVADPLFEDAAHGDYRLRPGSPAAGIGFKPFDPRKAGRRRR